MAMDMMLDDDIFAMDDLKDFDLDSAAATDPRRVTLSEDSSTHETQNRSPMSPPQEMALLFGVDGKHVDFIRDENLSMPTSIGLPLSAISAMNTGQPEHADNLLYRDIYGKRLDEIEPYLQYRLALANSRMEKIKLLQDLIEVMHHVLNSGEIDRNRKQFEQATGGILARLFLHVFPKEEPRSSISDLLPVVARPLSPTLSPQSLGREWGQVDVEKWMNQQDMKRAFESETTIIQYVWALPLVDLHTRAVFFSNIVQDISCHILERLIRVNLASSRSLLRMLDEGGFFSGDAAKKFVEENIAGKMRSDMATAILMKIQQLSELLGSESPSELAAEVRRLANNYMAYGRSKEELSMIKNIQESLDEAANQENLQKSEIYKNMRKRIVRSRSASPEPRRSDHLQNRAYSASAENLKSAKRTFSRRKSQENLMNMSAS